MPLIVSIRGQTKSDDSAWTLMAWAEMEVGFKLKPDLQEEYNRWINALGRQSSSTVLAKRDIFAAAKLAWLHDHGVIGLSCTNLLVVGPAILNRTDAQKLLDKHSKGKLTDRYMVLASLYHQDGQPVVVRTDMLEVESGGETALRRVVGRVTTIKESAHDKLIKQLDEMAASAPPLPLSRQLVFAETPMMERLPVWLYVACDREQAETLTPVPSGDLRSIQR